VGKLALAKVTTQVLRSSKLAMGFFTMRDDSGSRPAYPGHVLNFGRAR
jgi:hypothetical protein